MLTPFPPHMHKQIEFVNFATRFATISFKELCAHTTFLLSYGYVLLSYGYVRML